MGVFRSHTFDRLGSLSLSLLPGLWCVKKMKTAMHARFLCMSEKRAVGQPGVMGSHAWGFMHVRKGGNELKMSIGGRNGSHGHLKNGYVV